MRILITGGAGFIGTHLRRAMEADGYEVRLFDSLLPQVHGVEPSLEFGESEFIEGDVRDIEAASAVMKGIDVVYHLAAETGVGQSQYEIERYISTNTLGTAVVLQAAAKSDVGHVVITSSRAVYGNGVHKCQACGNRFLPSGRAVEDLEQGDWEVKCTACGNDADALLMAEDDPFAPVSMYGLTKVQQEQIGYQVRQAYPISVTNLRLFNVFGPGQALTNPYVGVLGAFYRRIAAGKEIDVYEDGKMRRDFVYVGDVVDALKAAGETPELHNKSINVGTGVAVTLERAGLELFRLMAREPKLNFSGKFRVGDIHHAVADVALAQNTLPNPPRTSFETGLEKFVEWADGSPGGSYEIDLEAEAQLAENKMLGRAAR